MPNQLTSSRENERKVKTRENYGQDMQDSIHAPNYLFDLFVFNTLFLG